VQKVQLYLFTLLGFIFLLSTRARCPRRFHLLPKVPDFFRTLGFWFSCSACASGRATATRFLPRRFSSGFGFLSSVVLCFTVKPSCQVRPSPGQRLAVIFLVVLCQSSLVLVFPVGFCSARFHFAGLRWLFSRRVVSSFSARIFHQFGFQFLLEEPLFFYFDSGVLGKALFRWITGHVLQPPEHRARFPSLNCTHTTSSNFRTPSVG
jgi:hypothetical protein